MHICLIEKKNPDNPTNQKRKKNPVNLIPSAELHFSNHCKLDAAEVGKSPSMFPISVASKLIQLDKLRDSWNVSLLKFYWMVWGSGSNAPEAVSQRTGKLPFPLSPPRNLRVQILSPVMHELLPEITCLERKWIQIEMKAPFYYLVFLKGYLKQHQEHFYFQSLKPLLGLSSHPVYMRFFRSSSSPWLQRPWVHLHVKVCTVTKLFIRFTSFHEKLVSIIN